MPLLRLKLNRSLFDLFQHCEIRCRAACCGWDAFDFSEHWLYRWCEFRDADAVRAARAEIDALRQDLAGRDPTAIVELDRFFNPSVASLTAQLNALDAVLASWPTPT